MEVVKGWGLIWYLVSDATPSHNKSLEVSRMVDDAERRFWELSITGDTKQGRQEVPSLTLDRVRSFVQRSF